MAEPASIDVPSRPNALRTLCDPRERELALMRGAHVRANGIRQHYLHLPGNGPRLLIVPGIVSPAPLWSHVAASLAERHEVFVLDVRGRGLSEAGAHLDYGLDACAQDVVAFVKTLALGRVVALGHSMGARIAVRAQAASPGLFASLVLVDPPTSGPGRAPYPVPKSRTLALLQAARRGEGLAAIRQSAGKPWPEDLAQVRAEWLATCDERAVHAAYDDFHAEDLFADLARTDVPVSLIAAGVGGVVSDGDLDEMRRIRPGLRAVRVEGAGHQMQAEDFELFERALGAVLRERRLASDGDGS